MFIIMATELVVERGLGSSNALLNNDQCFLVLSFFNHRFSDIEEADNHNFIFVAE